MLRNKTTWLSSDSYHKLITLTALLVLSTIFGCGGGGESSPITSNLSTTPSTEADSSAAETNPPSSDVASLPDDLHTGDAEAPVDMLNSTSEESDASLTADSQAEENPPPQPPTGIPVVALNSTPTGASAEVTWPPSADQTVSGYYVYYGRQPSGEPGVCSYEGRYAVDSSSVTITDLEPNTPYFFAVSSYSSYESPCTNETAVVTPPAGA